MTDWIKLSLVADAYDLTLDHCAKLAEHVTCAYRATLCFARYGTTFVKSP